MSSDWAQSFARVAALRKPGSRLDLDLDNGLRVRLRPIEPTDAPLLVAGFERLSPESRFMRFFTGMSHLTPAHLEYFTQIDYVDHYAVGASDRDRKSDVAGSPEGLGIGVARYIRSTDQPDEAESAVAVIDEYHGRGVGTLLLEALGVVAKTNGIDRFVSPVMTSNAMMLETHLALGGRTRAVPGDDTTVRAVIDLPGPDADFSESSLYAIFRDIAARGDSR